MKPTVHVGHLDMLVINVSTINFHESVNIDCILEHYKPSEERKKLKDHSLQISKNCCCTQCFVDMTEITFSFSHLFIPISKVRSVGLVLLRSVTDTLAFSCILSHALAYSYIRLYTLAYPCIPLHTLAHCCILLHTLHVW